MIPISQTSLLDNAAITSATAIHHTATVFSAQWQRFWQRSTTTIQADIAAAPEKAVALLALTQGAAAFCNPALDAFAGYVNDSGQPVFSNRVLMPLPDGWVFDPQTGELNFEF